MPELEQVRRELAGTNVGFLALSMEPDESLVRRAAAQAGLQMPVGIVRTEILGPLGLRAVPSTIFVDGTGTVVATASGSRSRRFHEERARALAVP